MRTPTRIPYAGIICNTHGKVDIEYDEYMRQMGQPGTRWTCPICRMYVEFDGRRFDELHPEPEE